MLRSWLGRLLPSLCFPCLCFVFFLSSYFRRSYDNYWTLGYTRFPNSEAYFLASFSILDHLNFVHIITPHTLPSSELWLFLTTCKKEPLFWVWAFFKLKWNLITVIQKCKRKKKTLTTCILLLTENMFNLFGFVALFDILLFFLPFVLAICKVSLLISHAAYINQHPGSSFNRPTYHVHQQMSLIGTLLT